MITYTPEITGVLVGRVIEYRLIRKSTIAFLPPAGNAWPRWAANGKHKIAPSDEDKSNWYLPQPGIKQTYDLFRKNVVRDGGACFGNPFRESP